MFESEEFRLSLVELCRGYRVEAGYAPRKLVLSTIVLPSVHAHAHHVQGAA